MDIIKENINAIRRLCDQHAVEELYVFGSVVTGGLVKESDIDLLVKFSGVEPSEYFDNYMDFKESLEDLFSRTVDLVEVQTVKNPILKRSIERNKVHLYGRESTQITV